MKKPHFYYKATADSSVGQQLKALMDKCNEVSEQARLFAERVGATSYIESPDGLAGGIAALEIDNCLGKEGLERVVMPNGNAVFLPSEGSDLEKEMFALPIVSESELISIFQFKPRVTSFGKPLPFTFGHQTPIVFLFNGYWYADMPYESLSIDVVSIDEKQFHRKKLSAVRQA